MAVQRAANDVAGQIKTVAAEMLMVEPNDVELTNERAGPPEGDSVSLSQVAHRSLYGENQQQIGALASCVPESSPPPFLASFAEIRVDVVTGKVEVVDFIAAVDCGTAINPQLAEGQVEGAVVNGIGFALMEEMVFDHTGRCRTTDLGRYKIPSITDVPPLEVVLVESFEPTGPMGAKSVSEIGINAPIPAIANAIHDATGIWLTETPFTAERVWRALNGQES
jgi:CO/xanthine dehydrogenase Mo-binding subunit